MKNAHNSDDILVSTIIPSYNKHHFLKEALFSVLDQTHENQEVIIINDYPTEEAKEAVNECKSIDKRVKTLHNITNIGIAKSRNKAISCAKGALIATLDHDDLWADPDKLKKQISMLMADKNLAVVGSQYYDIDRDGTIIRAAKLPLTDREIRKKINMQMPSLQSSFLFQKKVLDDIGGFNPRVSMSDDYEILFRALRVGTMQNLPDYTTHYRRHENTSIDPQNARIMRYNSFNVLLENGFDYPYYTKAILKRVFWNLPYGAIRPYLSDDLVHKAKNIRNILLGRSNQSYNHTNSQDATLEQ